MVIKLMVTVVDKTGETAWRRTLETPHTPRVGDSVEIINLVYFSLSSHVWHAGMAFDGTWEVRVDEFVIDHAVIPHASPLFGTSARHRFEWDSVDGNINEMLDESGWRLDDE